jgi:2-polyprenyl-3-methyl-5-hydroxy-6-metoxy-1,4-benzoquinol methylase
MISSNSAKPESGIDRKTISDFGDQWTRYTDNSGHYGSLALFADICEPLLRVDDLRGKIVADIGSGTGRIVNMLLDAGAAHVTAIEPSESFRIIIANTAARADKVQVIHGDGLAIPQNGAFDIVTSIGVLHHVENPGPIVEAASRALKPGGRIFIWLYGRERNGIYLALIEPLRVVTRRMPHRVLALFCYIMDVVVMVYTGASQVVPLPLRHYLQTVYSRLAPNKRRLVIYDQLNPAYAKYYREDEARSLLEQNGFRNVRTHHRHGYSWSVTGETSTLR